MSNKEETVYVLSKDVIGIAKAEKKIRTRLQLALKLSDDDICKELKENSPYGRLTSVKAIDIFQQETHIPPGKILVEVPATSIKKAPIKSKPYTVYSE